MQLLLEEVPYKVKRGAIGFLRFQPSNSKMLRIRKAAKVKKLPAAEVARRKDSRFGKSVSAPVVSERRCSGAMAIEVVPACHEVACRYLAKKKGEKRLQEEAHERRQHFTCRYFAKKVSEKRLDEEAEEAVTQKEETKKDA